MIASHLRLCYVLNVTAPLTKQQKQHLSLAIQGGVTAVQLRAKFMPAADMQVIAMQLQRLLQPLQIPLIINDAVDVAIAVNAAGLHLGQADMLPAAARALLKPEQWIGWSLETPADLIHANQLPYINYVAASSVFATQTKTDCKTHWGLAGLTYLTKKSRHPVVAIGGVDIDTIAAVMACRPAGVAVVSALQNAADPKATACRLFHAIQEVHGV